MTAEQRFFPIWKMCLCAAVVLSLMGCAAKHGDKAVNSPDVQAVETTSSVGAASVADSDSAFEDYDDEESEAIADPLEGWNRFWFGFNDVLLLKVVKPSTRGIPILPRRLCGPGSAMLFTISRCLSVF